MKQFVVIGLGRFGSSIARALTKRNFEVLAIDKNEAQVKALEGVVSQAVVMDATNEKSLSEMGIGEFDTAIVSMGDTIEASIMITLVLKEMGVKQVIVKAKSELHAKVLKRVGADRITFPEREMADRLAESLASPRIFDFIEVSETYEIVEMAAPKKFANKTLADIKLRDKYRVSAVAIKRKIPYSTPDGSTDFKEEIIVGPGGSDEIISGDVLILLGCNEDIDKLKDL